MRRASSPAKQLGSPYEAAVQFLANRPRSVSEIRRHLHGKRYDDDAIDGAIDKLRAQRYVNDLDFAKYWIEQRSRFRPKGDRALVSELINKGVTRETIDTALGETPAESESDRARRAIVRQLMRWQSLEPPERKRKIHAFLAQRGFGYDVIDEVIAKPEIEATID
ncbi:MAG: RecX family transcriptional regulator [Chloroflexota bacterium]|nr:RecX family transcriptional regulator [Chloroflexota bacterium]